jgi:methylated-DNA-[protein]-cysteine S-methyltransferase
MVSAAPRRLRSRRLLGSSLARRQSPRAQAFRQGRHGFFLASAVTRYEIDIARAVCRTGGRNASRSRFDCIMTRIFTPIVLATVATDWGPMHIAAGPDGVVAGELLGTAEGFMAGLARRGYAAPVPLEAAEDGPARAVAIAARVALAAALDGEPVDLRAVPIDIADRSAWDRLVLEGVRTIPRGETASYGEVARRIGRPRAARAVGGAVGRNPVGLLVPCHRVIAGDGSLGGYGAAAWGGIEAALEVKRALLRLEGVEIG